MPNCVIPMLLFALLCCPAPGRAEPAGRTFRGAEAFADIGWGHLFRSEDRTFGDRPTIGGGVAIRLSPRIEAAVEVSRMVGLTAASAPCALAVPCVGSAREGVLSATVASADVRYYFAGARVRPYLTAGIGALWTRTVNSVTIARPTEGILTEFEERDTGLAINVGAGLRIALTRALSLRPEITVCDSSVRSRQNLTLVRTSVAVGYGW